MEKVLANTPKTQYNFSKQGYEQSLKDLSVDLCAVFSNLRSDKIFKNFWSFDQSLNLKLWNSSKKRTSITIL